MNDDIRDMPSINHDDVVALNFIRKEGPCVFRKHFRQGLRSHVVEVLDPADVALEKSGTLIDGVRWYPRAKPYRIFRLFRTRLNSPDDALKEIERVRLVEKYLAPRYMAMSTEFVVDYRSPEGWAPLLCGFQEYVAGEIIDPWSILENERFVSDMYDKLCEGSDPSAASKRQWMACVKKKGARFIGKIKRMIAETSHIPDLAGVGNLVMAPSGEIKLVDINNISRVFFDSVIRLDDRGYPVCDKSIETLHRLERKILGPSMGKKDEIYQTFLDTHRMREVQKKETVFTQGNV